MLLTNLIICHREARFYEPFRGGRHMGIFLKEKIKPFVDKYTGICPFNLKTRNEHSKNSSSSIDWNLLPIPSRCIIVSNPPSNAPPEYIVKVVLSGNPCALLMPTSIVNMRFFYDILEKNLTFMGICSPSPKFINEMEFHNDTDCSWFFFNWKIESYGKKVLFCNIKSKKENEMFFDYEDYKGEHFIEGKLDNLDNACDYVQPDEWLY
jgi:hypothetical protein